MPTARTEHDEDLLRELARFCGDPRQAARARAIATVMAGASRAEAVRSRGMQILILLDRAEGCNEEGFDGLASRRRSRDFLRGWTAVATRRGSTGWQADRAANAFRSWRTGRSPRFSGGPGRDPTWRRTA